MSTKFVLSRDINGFNGYGLPFTDTAYSCTIAATTDTTLTIPYGNALGNQGPEQGQQTSQWLALFNFDAQSDVWVALNTTASAPAGSSFVATSSELNPGARRVKGGDVLHFYSVTGTVNICVLLYSLA